MTAIPYFNACLEAMICCLGESVSRDVVDEEEREHALGGGSGATE